jgi:hypothetical protein
VGGASTELEEVRLAGPVLLAVVPAGLDPQSYDLTVDDPRGNQVVRPGAFRIVSPAENVTRFEINPIDTARLGIPFSVIITAVDTAGATVSGFEGSVTLSDATGALTPTVLGPFTLGKMRAPVSVGALATGNVLSVSDVLGHTGASNPFDVIPGMAVAVAFSSPSTQTVAGQCSSALQIQAKDAAGRTARFEEAFAAELSSSDPGGISFFSSAACTVVTGTVALAAGTSEATVYLRSTRAGRVVLRARAAGLPTATQLHTIAPGPPVSLTFSTPPRDVEVNECSRVLGVELVDMFGNVSPATSAFVADVAVDPLTRLSFFADAACTQSAQSVAVPASASEATFYALGEVPDSVRITVTPTSVGLGAASQAALVAP